jgi:signal transduction histidine kinase
MMNEAVEASDDNSDIVCEVPVAVEVQVAKPNGESDLSNDTINKLAYGVVNSLLPDLSRSKKLLSDVTESQRVLIETLQQENAKFAECQVLQEVMETMNRAKLYHGKLVNIKKEMLLLHEKTAQLKRRALRLQQQKQMEALDAEQRRERELEKERALMARDVTGRKTP